MDRLSIYAALGVPEVLRLSSAGLAFYILDNGSYQIRPNSLAFPRLASSDLWTFLAQVKEMDAKSLLKQFRQWTQKTLLP